MTPPTIFLIDDDPAVSRALEAVGELMNLPVRAFSSAEQFLETAPLNEPGCLILDIKLPGLSGLELLDRLRESACELPVIVISGHADVPQAVLAMQRGALTVLEKPFGLETLITQVRDALDRDQRLREQRRRRDEARQRLATLTDREREVLDLIVRGLSNKQIAADLNLTRRAIEDRRARLMRRLAVRSVPELLALVQRSEPEPSAP